MNCGKWYKIPLWAEHVGMSVCSAEILNRMYYNLFKHYLRYKFWFSLYL